MTKSVIHIPSNEAPCGLEKIRESVSKIVGVFDTETNHVNELLTVEYDQDRVSLDQIRCTINEVCNCHVV
jgi:copper chaperone CopZ